MSVQVPVSGLPTRRDPRTAQPSRKGKKAWRRNIDSSDADAALQGRADEQRLGGRRLAETENEGLFVIDAKGDEDQRQKLKVYKLKIHEIIAPDSKLPALSLPRKSTSGSKKQLSKQELARLQRQKEKLERRKDSSRPTLADDEVEDPWADPLPDPLESNEYLAPVRTVPVKRPRTFERKPPSASTPAVIPSDPGTSYNPTYEAHQNLLKRAVDVEVVKEREKEAVAKRMEYPAELDLLDPDHEIAMIEDGEDEEEEVQRMDQDDDDDDDDAGAAPRAPRPLTQAERNKKKRRLELSKQEEEQRLRKKQAREISNLGTLLKEVKKKSRFDAPIRPVPQTEADPKRLGPHKFKEAPIEVNLTEELSESLRSIKPDGNLFKDRFVGLQRRKLIEPRIRQVRKRRYKEKFYEKPSYRFLAV